MFKRLESSGPAFLLTVRRHIIRNSVYIAALTADGGALPIGSIITAADTDEAFESAEDEDTKLFDNEAHADFRGPGESIYQKLRNASQKEKYDWVPNHYFTPELQKDLQDDVDNLQKILNLVPDWQPQSDRKFQALLDLVKTTHGKDKILIFSQYKDTVNYLHTALINAGVEDCAHVHGQSDDIFTLVRRFSPKSNEIRSGAQKELRVLVSTDTLSEGQNLQDAHIVVNYDLPWALIRLIQRAGRVDRIGQDHDEIQCYTALRKMG